MRSSTNHPMAIFLVTVFCLLVTLRAAEGEDYDDIYRDVNSNDEANDNFLGVIDEAISKLGSDGNLDEVAKNYTDRAASEGGGERDRLFLYNSLRRLLRERERAHRTIMRLRMRYKNRRDRIKERYWLESLRDMIINKEAEAAGLTLP